MSPPKRLPPGLDDGEDFEVVEIDGRQVTVVDINLNQRHTLEFNKDAAEAMSMIAQQQAEGERARAERARFTFTEPQVQQTSRSKIMGAVAAFGIVAMLIRPELAPYVASMLAIIYGTVETARVVADFYKTKKLAERNE